MELKKRVLNIKFEDREIVVRFPTVSQQMEFSKRYDDAKDNPMEAVNLIIGFLCSLGMPEEVAGQLESDHLSDILEAFNAKKK